MRAMQIDRWVDTLARRGQPRTRERARRPRSTRTGRSSRNAGVTNHGQYGRGGQRDVRHATTSASSWPTGSAPTLSTTSASSARRRRAGARPGRRGRACRRCAPPACALGIVCDVGLTGSPILRARLEGFGLLGYFDAWSFSDETGWFKPAAGAFRAGARGAGRPRGRGGARRRQRAHRRRGREGAGDDRGPVHRAGHASAAGSPSSCTRARSPITSSTTWPTLPGVLAP